MTTAVVRVAAPWLALLAAPMSFGIAGLALILPEAADVLQVSLASATVIVVAFGWGIAVGTPLLAGLLSHKGTRFTLLACAALVGAGTVLMVAVPALPVLVVGSALQALGMAGQVVIAMHLAGTPAALGVVTASMASVGAVSPLAGSAVADLLSWQAVLALPALSLLAIPAIIGRALPAPPAERQFDATGAILVTALVTALTVVPHQPLIAAAAAVLAAVLVAAHLRREPDGFLPAILVRTPEFRTAALLGVALAVANFGILYAAPRMLADRLAWTTGEVGTLMVFPYLAGGLASWFLITAAARMLLGGLAAAATIAVVIVVLGSPVALLVVAMFLASLVAATGQGVLVVRATGALPDRYRATAVGMITLCYLLGAAFGPAIAALAA
ncbi:MFS transporter [Kibdelosporangium philippinense]|uniref:MFS transporter n=1 Tax=Kibdelosporangium philippinense TaxID=211113 RepID=A0ABS8Z3L2_9PSEU|nr:MFS transporter [Kibdelosporangium philippinense]MCE7002524.1 MFS transporter [Kibdelosporangium philippinense]